MDLDIYIETTMRSETTSNHLEASLALARINVRESAIRRLLNNDNAYCRACGGKLITV